MGFAAGLALVLATTRSVVITLVVPRSVPSRMSVFVGRRVVRSFFVFVADRFSDWEDKDRILAYGGPVALLAVFVVWLLLFVAGYGLMLWPVTGKAFGSALRESGSSVFTLGIASTVRPGPTVVDLFAGATGLIVVALEIAYLPTIYAAFARRETLVTLLQSRAGNPPWGPEILARHQVVGLLGSLPGLYRDWEQWAADVAESHTTYSVLVSFRSPRPMSSWVLALLAVLDAAALQLAFNPRSAPTEARLCLRMGFTCLRDIADALGVPFDHDPLPTDPVVLTEVEFSSGVERLASVGFTLERTPEEAWPHFRAWRVNYESIAYTLARYTNAVPGPWSGQRRRGATIEPVRPVDRTPDDPKSERHAPGRWAG
ncbi:MAG: hypothetical protein ACR2HY_06230 [Acidimicrobiales bacterium]